MPDDIYRRALSFHRKHRGKLELSVKIPLTTRDDLSLAYTPGVAAASEAIARNPEEIWELTSRGNWVAVVTDGSSVLGLGDIGAPASLPVMEGKCAIFKEFGGLSAFPIALQTRDIDEFVNTVKLISLSFGAVNLEDIAAPRCFEIEERLKKELDIPVMHDDQHATAIVVIAGLMNALSLTGRTFESASFTISGAGAAGVAIAKLLRSVGAKDIVMVDRKGIMHRARAGLDQWRASLLDFTNLDDLRGDLREAMKGRDVFIGVSGPGIVDGEMVKSMNKDPILFALANPTPEIMPDSARAAGAKIIATGRSDFPNQVNNALVFPGIFKGVLEARAPQITEHMKLAAAKALAHHVKKPSADNIIPDIFDADVVGAIADAVTKEAKTP